MSRTGSWDVVALLAIAVIGLLIWFVASILRKRMQPVTVFEYQTGLRYKNGKLVETLGPGRYSLFWPSTAITVEDMREQLLVVGGQEMLTSDNLAVKVSLAVRHRTADARKKASHAQEPDQLLYSDLQVALRQAVASRTLEALLAERGGISQDLTAAVSAKATARGVEVIGVDVRDLMLSGETKRAYTDIFRAKKDGEAALERARGETAALRNLANGARLLQGNPALFNLRLLQTLTTSAAKGATVVLNTSGEPMLMTGTPPSAAKDEVVE
jgi:regulator of protease activity HflC (stomatin/prohibitin superfamily)